ncbi:MAG: DUF481 domain-containing protein [Turneriella sp.]|nr:DUF481 domain-containing protein [Turneriella sp.]
MLRRFLFFTVGFLPAAIYANAVTDTEPVEVKSARLLTARLAAGYSYSYFDAVQSLRQDNSLLYSDGVNSARLGTQILGGLSTSEGKFNSIIGGGYDRYLLKWLEAFTFATYESNVIASVRGKFLSGAGMKVVFVKTPDILLDCSLAPTYVQTTYTALPMREDLSLSLRARLRWRIVGALNLAIPYFMVIDTKNSSDQWHSLEPSLTYAFAENADVSTGYRYRYNVLNQAYAGIIYMTVAARFKN